MATNQYDIIIIGGGIVGLATALQIKTLEPHACVLLIEKETAVAQHQTGNNSGVIHSGIYYKPGSLRALNCLRGYKMLLAYCEQKGIHYDICGKLIVATQESELERLQNLYTRGQENGLTGIKLIDGDAIKEYEPHCRGIRAIVVPQTGIIDYSTVSQSYLSDIRSLGVTVNLGERVMQLASNTDSCQITTNKSTYTASIVINCAGLYADKVANLVNPVRTMRIIPFRGEYYIVKPEKQHLVKHLIYPVPDPNFPFLGVHFTRLIEGGVEAGPNAVLAYAREGYKKTDVNLSELIGSITFRGFQKLAFKYYRTGIGELYRSYSKSAFTKALQRLIPEIQKEDLIPGGAGVRASATSVEGGVIDDFIIQDDGRFIHILNSPSPAATASLSIGQSIAEKAIAKLSAT